MVAWKTKAMFVRSCKEYYVNLLLIKTDQRITFAQLSYWPTNSEANFSLSSSIRLRQPSWVTRDKSLACPFTQGWLLPGQNCLRAVPPGRDNSEQLDFWCLTDVDMSTEKVRSDIALSTKIILASEILWTFTNSFRMKMNNKQFPIVVFMFTWVWLASVRKEN